MSNLNLLSLFSGAGGMDLGFKNAGFNILWANDFQKDAVETYKNNIGNHIVLGDITKIDSSEIPNGYRRRYWWLPMSRFQYRKCQKKYGRS